MRVWMLAALLGVWLPLAGLAQQAGTAPATPTPPDEKAVVAQVEPGVVTIYTTKSKGSGFFVNPHGYLLTNNHVVDNVEKLQVEVQGGGKYEGTVIARDAQRDLAVIQIPFRNMPVLTMGDAKKLAVRDALLAFGSPQATTGTVTGGKVSNTDVEIAGQHFVMIDVVLNPGNSGGPLVDMQGRVVGINTAVEKNPAAPENQAYAIPINDAVAFLDKQNIGVVTAFANSEAMKAQPVGPPVPPAATPSRPGAATMARPLLVVLGSLGGILVISMVIILATRRRERPRPSAAPGGPAGGYAGGSAPPAADEPDIDIELH